jgi:hypothetical protein
MSLTKASSVFAAFAIAAAVITAQPPAPGRVRRGQWARWLRTSQEFMQEASDSGRFLLAHRHNGPRTGSQLTN